MNGCVCGTFSTVDGKAHWLHTEHNILAIHIWPVSVEMSLLPSHKVLPFPGHSASRWRVCQSWLFCPGAAFWKIIRPQRFCYSLGCLFVEMQRFKRPQRWSVLALSIFCQEEMFCDYRCNATNWCSLKGLVTVGSNLPVLSVSLPSSLLPCGFPPKFIICLMVTGVKQNVTIAILSTVSRLQSILPYIVVTICVAYIWAKVICCGFSVSWSVVFPCLLPCNKKRCVAKLVFLQNTWQM